MSSLYLLLIRFSNKYRREDIKTVYRRMNKMFNNHEEMRAFLVNELKHMERLTKTVNFKYATEFINRDEYSVIIFDIFQKTISENHKYIFKFKCVFLENVKLYLYEFCNTQSTMGFFNAMSISILIDVILLKLHIYEDNGRIVYHII